MRVVTLGTGSPLPDANRAGPATLVDAAGRSFLFDCGRAVLMRCAAAGVAASMLDMVLLTHLHSDHVCDFSDVVTSRWITSPSPNPLRVVGPIGTAGFVERTLAMLADDVGYRLAHHDDLSWEPSVDVTEVEHGEVLADGDVRITAAPTDHAPVRPTVGYRVDADGGSVVIAGDTVPCHGLDELCAGASVYVQTVVRRSLVEIVPMQRFRDILDYHSSIEDAASTAQRAGVRTLVMTHLVPSPWPGTEPEWAETARATFDGEVVVAHDLLSIEA